MCLKMSTLRKKKNKRKWIETQFADIENTTINDITVLDNIVLRFYILVLSIIYNFDNAIP